MNILVRIVKNVRSTEKTIKFVPETENVKVPELEKAMVLANVMLDIKDQPVINAQPGTDMGSLIWTMRVWIRLPMSVSVLFQIICQY